MVRIEDQGIIFRNPSAETMDEKATMPGLVQLSAEEFFCVFHRGRHGGEEVVDASYGKCRSTDGGKTYVDEELVWDRGDDDRPYTYIYAYPILMADSSLLMTGCRWDRSVQKRYVYNPETLGAVPCDSLLFRSTDGGRTWSAPQVVKLPDGRTGNTSSRIVPLKDGRLLLPIETWKAWDDSSPPMQSSLALFSSDNGETWDDYSVAAHDPEGRIVHWNGMFTRLQDGRIFVMYWAKDYQTGGDLTINATWSEDEGRTWVDVYDTGILGQMGSCIDIGHGRVLAVYNRRDVDKPGIYVAVSGDGGRTWPPFKDHTVIWDAAGRDVRGIRDREDNGIFDEGLFAFGKPDALLLPGGDVYIGYWATVDRVSHLRWCRLHVRKTSGQQPA